MMKTKILKRAGLRGGLIVALFTLIVLIIPLLHGCKKAAPPVKSPKKAEEPAKPDLQAEIAAQEAAKSDQGYVYERRDRRDPFVPLIETKKKVKKDDKKLPGTLTSYDIIDFKILAIAKKGNQRYALLLAPGNRSFTVYEGTVIGVNNGKIEKITENEVITIEQIENYLGKIEARRLILELHKGR
jgi:Tfp pilus assembly protein PilP